MEIGRLVDILRSIRGLLGCGGLEGGFALGFWGDRLELRLIYIG